MFHEPPYIHFKPGGRFLDIGAYHGSYTYPAARFCSYALAIEPNPENAQTIREGITLRRLLNAEVLEVAISNIPGGTVRGFNLQKDTQITTIDEIWDLKGPFDSLKIDIEGDEEQAIQGASNTIEEGCVLNIEVHKPHLEVYQAYPDYVCSYLVSKGCDVYVMDERTYPLGTNIHYIVASKPKIPSSTP